MIPQSFLNALEVWLSEEIAGKLRLLRELERQERALVKGTADEIEVTTRCVEAEIMAEIERSRRREAIFARLAAQWNVAASALTLSSIVERASGSGQRIDELRIELRALASTALRRNRRIARLVHVHQTIVQETVAALIGTSGHDEEPGALYSARI